jgi:uncharacterized protein with HEPN domain
LKDETVYLRHILDEIIFLERIAKDRTLKDLTSDDYFSHAVRSAIEIIGEAANNVPVSVKSRYPDVPWKEMAALRNRIIHGYFRIDYSIVWNVIAHDLPDVRPRIMTILQEMDTKT